MGAEGNCTHSIPSALAPLGITAGTPHDPLPGQPDNAFRIIKNLFTSFPPGAEGKRAEAIGKK